MNELTVTVEGKMKSGKSWVVMVIANALEQALGATVRVTRSDLSADAMAMRLEKLKDGSFKMADLEVDVVEKQLPRLKEMPYPAWVARISNHVDKAQDAVGALDELAGGSDPFGRLVHKALDQLLSAFMALQDGLGLDPEADIDKDTITVPLALSDTDWCELINAVGSRARSVENDGVMPDMTETQQAAWVQQLDDIYEKVGTELSKRGVDY
jgi:hypothetical protein